MGWIRFPTKATIQAGLKAADPGAALAAKTLADLMITHLERLGDARAVEGMVYSALKRAAAEAHPEAKARTFDALVLAKVHGETISDLAVAMTVFIARDEEQQPVKGADVEDLVRGALVRLAATGS